jgi:glycosyltransferase involved in cell wall biosynthesis
VRFGYVGRLHPNKGLMELARAVAQLPRDLPFELELRGPMMDASSREFAVKLKDAFAGDPRVRFEPAVAPQDVPPVLAALDVLLCPSTWFENGPTVAIEANAVGTPVIGSRIGNLAELIRDGVDGRLVPAGDVSALSRAIAEAVANPKGTIDAWRRALLPARTMDDIARDYLTMYDGVFQRADSEVVHADQPA